MKPFFPKDTERLLNRLWLHVDLERRKYFFLLLALMIFVSFAEVVSIGLLLPFLGVLTNSERVFQYTALKPFLIVFGVARPGDLLLPLTLAFCLAAILAGGARLILMWATTRFSFMVGADISGAIYRRTLYQPYSVHLSRNSSEVISGISTKTNTVIYDIINPLLTAASSLIILIAILTALFWVNSIVAVITIGGFGVIYLLIVTLTKAKLNANGKRIASESTKVIKSLQEGLGGIRDVLLNGSQEIYCEIYQKADLSLRRAQGSNQFIISCPRFVMEAMGMVLIAGIAFFLTQYSENVGDTIIILGVFALGAQRLLPVLQQLYASLSSVRGNQALLHDVINLLEQEIPKIQHFHQSESISFDKCIELSEVSFRYSEATPLILNDINLKILKGSRIGIIGSSGSGKSTLVDIVMSLLSPSSGFLKIDEVIITEENRRSWQEKIAHVPQMIYLADATIAENIAFGEKLENIDLDRVKKSATQAQLANVIESWAGGYSTKVGERGIRLSGGQRQRIAIARALYNQPDVIVFDEATSALDNETERSLMEAIRFLSSDLTILLIAHRLTTLSDCDQIIELDSGLIKMAGSFGDIAKK